MSKTKGKAIPLCFLKMSPPVSPSEFLKRYTKPLQKTANLPQRLVYLFFGVALTSRRIAKQFRGSAGVIAITILMQDKIIVKTVITPEAMLTKKIFFRFLIG